MSAKRLLAITFIESLTTTLVERGIYFFSRTMLGFSDSLNLWLALAFGAAYVMGALCSHPLCRRLKEKHLLAITIAGQFAVHLWLGFSAGTAAVFVGSSIIAFWNGLKWPVVESYVASGHTPSSAAGAIGRFNCSWAAAVPLGLLVVGPIIDRWPGGLFFLAAAMNAASMLLVAPLAGRPTHLPSDHPQRPGPEALTRYRMLLTASRWLMLFSYATLWILAALVPHIFDALRVGVGAASGLSGLIDVVRLLAFVLLGRFIGWHNRRGPLVAAMIAMPFGFALVLAGWNVPAVLAGELIFGVSAGTVYYASLYYAMIVKNAAVEAGGAHESLVGLGFALGPLVALAGSPLAGRLGSETLAVCAGVGPLFLLCAAAAIRALMAK